MIFVVRGEFKIMVISYRSYRGSLKDSLLTKKVFNNFDNFLVYVLNENMSCFPNIVLCKADISFMFNSSYDNRCGWRNIYTVCVNNCAVGFLYF